MTMETEKPEFLWTEKYRPHDIGNCILPRDLKLKFANMIETTSVDNMIFTGLPGTGKTTVAKALIESIQGDYMVINGSLNGNIDTLRNEIQRYASSKSFVGGRKYVILDEADYLNAQSTQPALRNFMEEFSRNCGFILTCNYYNKIIDPLKSRCTTVHFKIPEDEVPVMQAEIFKRLIMILNQEGVKTDKSALREVVIKYFPDIRKMINEVQTYARTGQIDSGILVSLSDENFRPLIKALKAKNFTEMRKWVGENTSLEAMLIMRRIFEMGPDIFKPSSFPPVVVILANYQDKHTRVPDHEINLVACLTEIMLEAEFV